MGRVGRIVERALWRGRLVVIVAVLGSFAAALTVLFATTVDLARLPRHVRAYADLRLTDEARAAMRDQLVTALVELVDGYLLAAVLLVFALGLYELFIHDIEEARRGAGASRLLVIESFDDLKDRLAKVIILILIVNLFRDALAIKLTRPLDLVAQGAAITLIAVAVAVGRKKSRS